MKTNGYAGGTPSISKLKKPKMGNRTYNQIVKFPILLYNDDPLN